MLAHPHRITTSAHPWFYCCFSINMVIFSNKKYIVALSVLMLAVWLSRCSADGKYSKNANMKATEDDIVGFENEDRPFRMKKVNLVWTKAKKILAEHKLAELYADLKVHDREEGLLKKLRTNGEDKDGKREAEVLQKYQFIMEYYGIDDYYKNEIPLTNDETKRVRFQDAKLQSMWKRAEKSGFSDEDLQMLKEEFWHQQMKLNEFEFMRRELKRDDVDPYDSMIDEVDQLALDKLKISPEAKKEKMHNLKKHNQDIKEGYMRLEYKASQLPKKVLEFKDYRVQKLWALAKKTNWSDLELDNFKEELKHFEQRLAKQDYYHEQLELTREGLKDQVMEEDEYPEKLVLLKERTELVKQKVKKLHNHMKTRLEKALRHTEL